MLHIAPLLEHGRYILQYSVEGKENGDERISAQSQREDGYVTWKEYQQSYSPNPLNTITLTLLHFDKKLV